MLENAWDEVQGSQPPPMHGPQVMYDRGGPAAQLQPALDGEISTDCYSSLCTYDYKVKFSFRVSFYRLVNNIRGLGGLLVGEFFLER